MDPIKWKPVDEIPRVNEIPKNTSCFIRLEKEEDRSALIKALRQKNWKFRSESIEKNFVVVVLDNPAILNAQNIFLADWCNMICVCCVNGPCSAFKEASSLLVYRPSINIQEPRNNDGRSICYWCNIQTQKRGNGAYDVCPNCGR
jgi:hypothetical protein